MFVYEFFPSRCTQTAPVPSLISYHVASEKYGLRFVTFAFVNFTSIPSYGSALAFPLATLEPNTLVAFDTAAGIGLPVVLTTGLCIAEILVVTL